VCLNIVPAARNCRRTLASATNVESRNQSRRLNLKPSAKSRPFKRPPHQRCRPKSASTIAWLSAADCSRIALVFLTVEMIYVSEQGGIVAAFRKQLVGRDPQTDEAFRQLENPAYLAFGIIFVLILVFVGSTLLPIIGGALGAKVLEKD
jgi:hypothetical protein